MRRPRRGAVEPLWESLPEPMPLHAPRSLHCPKAIEAHPEGRPGKPAQAAPRRRQPAENRDAPPWTNPGTPLHHSRTKCLGCRERSVPAGRGSKGGGHTPRLGPGGHGGWAKPPCNIRDYQGQTAPGQRKMKTGSPGAESPWAKNRSGAQTGGVRGVPGERGARALSERSGGRGGRRPPGQTPPAERHMDWSMRAKKPSARSSS